MGLDTGWDGSAVMAAQKAAKGSVRFTALHEGGKSRISRQG